MSSQEVTLTLPASVYEQIQRVAERSQRTVDQVLTEAVAALAPVIEGGLPASRAALAQLAYLNDAALWQAARATMTGEQQARLEALHDAQQRRTLTDEEQAEEQALLTLYRETILVRAQAALLLQQRGYDVADSGQFAPLE